MATVYSIKSFSITLCLALILPAFGDKQTIKFGVNSNFVKFYQQHDKLRWSHSIVQDLLERAGYQVKVLARPALRLPLSLKRQEIDVFLSSDGFEHSQYGFIRSRLPISLIRFIIYYDSKLGWRPSWPPDQNFKDKIGKSVQSTKALKRQYGLNVSQAFSFDAPVKMVNLGRADYYIENSGGFSQVSKGLLKAKTQGFSREVLYKRPIYLFARDEPGYQSLMKSIENHYLDLLMSRQYAVLFYRNDKRPEVKDSTKVLIEYINNNYQGLKVPTQLPKAHRQITPP